MNKLSRNERLTVILKLLSEHKTLSNAQLAKLLQVTPKTIRCDLVQLENEQQVIRTHGGVQISANFDADKYCLDRLLSQLTASKTLSGLMTQNLMENRVNNMKNNIFILGSFNVDIVATLERFPQPGETLHALSNNIGAGGKGANQAYAAAKAGANVTFMTKIGKDQFSHFAKEHLAATGIDKTIIVESEKSPTGNALIYVCETSGENMIAVHSGANTEITPAEILQAEQHIVSANLFLTQLENNIDAIRQSMQIAHTHGVRVVLNPAPYHEDTPSLLKYVDVITPNETEASLMTGIEVTDLSSAKLAAEKINQMGVNTVVITRGSQGVLVYENEQFKEVAAIKCVVTDTTGAGDAFNGALVAQIVKGETLFNAAKYANAYASLAVEREGAANMPDASLVAARL
ncbi:ribokinase [Shewanella sp. Choline-02u-19]|uniref:ribokinase n=1 Tax=unclassified Shewanella TaxID=196818 RepID=UPI000C34D417|nr:MULTISPECIES: ribokinase [unclassified Shewanella]PKG76823.1 ribokinase [Shewanella sp. GutCb]PKH57612.1 ribokinase [Shewanella sp. Bg11-22]PKI28473.1 ribokinase [Shewanella sp. Choline-02u-19]